MSLIVVVVGVCLVVGSKWSRLVLADEERYLWAVSPLASSPGFARLAGASVSFAACHRGPRRRGLPPRVARVVGAATSRGMGSVAFAPSWSAGQRAIHRHRHRPRSRRARLQVSALMVVLATMGPVVGATAWLVAPLGARSRQRPRTG